MEKAKLYYINSNQILPYNLENLVKISNDEFLEKCGIIPKFGDCIQIDCFHKDFNKFIWNNKWEAFDGILNKELSVFDKNLQINYFDNILSSTGKNIFPWSPRKIKKILLNKDHIMATFYWNHNIYHIVMPYYKLYPHLMPDINIMNYKNNGCYYEFDIINNKKIHVPVFLMNNRREICENKLNVYLKEDFHKLYNEAVYKDVKKYKYIKQYLTIIFEKMIMESEYLIKINNCTFELYKYV
jgi:hypothetical protein